MQANPITPLFCTTQLSATAAFYRDHLGFRTKAEMPGYVELEMGEGGPSLAFMEPSEDCGHVAAEGKGLMYCFGVDNADAEHARLVSEGVPIRETPEDRPWGERGFVAIDPNGIGLYFGHPIPAGAEVSG